jgi:hypothetical protein
MCRGRVILFKGIFMKKILVIILGIFAAYSYADDIVAAQQEIKNIPSPCHDSNGFIQSQSLIQANYNEMYRALPLDQQNRVRCAAIKMENLRLKPVLEAQTYFSSEHDRAELSMKTVVSQMLVTEAVKAQVETARQEIYRRINEKILDLKARRAVRH